MKAAAEPAFADRRHARRAASALSTAIEASPAAEDAAASPGAPKVESARLAPADLAGLERPTFLGTRARARSTSLALRVTVPAILFLAWWYGTASGYIPSSVLASPGDVASAFFELQETGQLKEFVLASVTRAGLGVALGVSVGLILGVTSGIAALGEDLVDPTMQMVRAVPFLAVVPLFISWFGVDEKFKILLIAAATTSPMYAHSYLGVRNVDRKIVEAARGFGLRGLWLMVRVVLPAALPNLLMALRICLAISVVGLIAAEQVGTTKGVGYLVLLAKQYYRQDYMMLCIVLYATLGLCFDGFIRLLERTTMPWRRHSAVR